MTRYFENDDEIVSLVEAFEACSIHPAEFKHYQHLAVALWYVANFPYDEASARMRTGIQKLAAAYGKSGYHETITRFWLEMVRQFLAGAATSTSLADLANRLGSECADKNLIRDYYSEELLNSESAKNGWAASDLKPLAAFVEI